MSNLSVASLWFHSVPFNSFIHSDARSKQPSRPKLKRKNGSDGWIAVIRGAGIRRHGTALSNVV